MLFTLVIVCAAVLSVQGAAVLSVQGEQACEDMGGHCIRIPKPCFGDTDWNDICGEDKLCCVGCSLWPTVMIRSHWGALPPFSAMGNFAAGTKVGLILIHHTALVACPNSIACAAQARGIQKEHINQGYGDIKYHFMIDNDGIVWTGRGWDVVGPTSNDYGIETYHVAFMGDYTNVLPTKNAIKAFHQLMSCGKKIGKISTSNQYNLLGHRDRTSGTTCPGDALYQEIQTWPHYNIYP